MNPKNDDKCFQQQITVALNHKNTKNDVLIIPNVKSFINKCNLKKKKKNCHMEKVRNDKEEIKQAYISKRNSYRENKVILFIIIVGEK